MADNLLAVYSYPPSEYTTADEMRQERISQGLGWDTSRPGREFLVRALTQLPLAAMPSANMVIPRAPGVTLPEIMRRTPPATPAPRSGSFTQRGPTQAQRDFHELNPRYHGFEYDAAANRGMNNPSISDAALDAMWNRHSRFNQLLREFENLPRPPNNRLNALLPFAGAGAANLLDESPY
jgi:hypothetical protein